MTKHLLTFKFSLRLGVKICIAFLCFWSIKALLFTVVEYNILLDDINSSVDCDDYFPSKYGKEKNIKISTIAKEQKGTAQTYYSNGNSKMELMCQAYPISFLKLLWHKFVMTPEYEIHKMDYTCKRVEYYEDGVKMLAAEYRRYNDVGYNSNILEFLKGEAGYFYSNINTLRHTGFYHPKIIGHSYSYYHDIPDRVKDINPHKYDICLSSDGFLTKNGDEDLCRKEDYMRYSDGKLHIKEYYLDGRLKLDLLYKDEYKDQILKGKIFYESGGISIKYNTQGNMLKELHYDWNNKLYKEITYINYQRNDIKLYSYSGDIEYILYFKDNKPDHGFKYEYGKETPLTNAHLYNVFKIRETIK